MPGADFFSMDNRLLSRPLLKATAKLDVWLVIESCDALLLNLIPWAAGLLYGNLQGELGGGGSSSKPRLSVPASFMWLLVSSSFLDERRLKNGSEKKNPKSRQIRNQKSIDYYCCVIDLCVLRSNLNILRPSPSGSSKLLPTRFFRWMLSSIMMCRSYGVSKSTSNMVENLCGYTQSTATIISPTPMHSKPEGIKSVG